MAQTKTIQLLRSSALYTPTAAGEGVSAKTALQNAKDALIALENRKDGEIVLARYQETGGSIKSLLGIFHDTPDLPGTATAGWTFLQDVTESEGSAAALQAEIDQIESSVGLGTDGTYTSGYTADPVAGTPTTLKATADNIITYIKGLDKSADAVDGKVVTTVSQADGQVSETKADLTDVKMGGYTKDTAATGAIASTDTLEQAFSKVENAIAKNTVSSTDKTVEIDTTGSTTDLSVNIDGTTLVANTSTGVISSDLKILKETTNLDTNVKEQYKLVYGSSTTAIGDVIKVYKDSALQEVYLGASTDTINASTGVITKNTVQDPQSMNFAYQLDNGTYSLTKIDVSKFLTESEFGDGLSVTGGVVSVNAGNGLEINSTSKAVDVKIDSTSESVITAYGATNTESPVLSVGANGVKVSNIQNAIDAKVGTLDVTDTAVAGQYVSAVNETDGKVSMTRANVADAVLTGYSKGNAPASGSEAVAATDDVKGAIAKLEHQVDAAVSAASTAVSGLDGTATASSATNLDTTPSADFKVLTKVVEVDGKVVETTVTNGSTAVTLKKLAATGAAADVSIADAGSLITATTVEGALQEIAGNLNAAKVVANDVITVDTTNNTTKLSVTTGNGLEKTGTNNDTLSVKAGDGITVDSNGVAVKAGAGLVINNSSKDVDVNVGNGLEIASDAVKIKLDTTTASHNITSDMLSISSNGLMMSDTWDCGTF